MSQQFQTLSGALAAATADQVRLDNGVAHLFITGTPPTPGITLADMLARECDFSGYVTKTITDWAGPVLAPTAGYMIIGNALLWVWDTGGSLVTNSVMGYFLVSAGGDLTDVVIFDDPIPMGGAGQSVPYTPVRVYVAG